MLGQLRQWEDYRRFHRDVAQLLRQQEELARNAAEMGRRTLTKELEDLSPEEAAELKVLGGRQLELARRLDRIEQEMEQSLGELRQNDPLAAATVADALDEARRLALTAAMARPAANWKRTASAKWPPATSKSPPDSRRCSTSWPIAASRKLGVLVEKLREAEGELDSIRRRQEGTPPAVAQCRQSRSGGAESGTAASRYCRGLVAAGDRAAGPPLGTPFGPAAGPDRAGGRRADGRGRPGGRPGGPRRRRRRGRGRHEDAGRGGPAVGRPPPPGPGRTALGATGPLGRFRQALDRARAESARRDAAVGRAPAAGSAVTERGGSACRTWPACSKHCKPRPAGWPSRWPPRGAFRRRWRQRAARWARPPPSWPTGRSAH